MKNIVLMALFVVTAAHAGEPTISLTEGRYYLSQLDINDQSFAIPAGNISDNALLDIDVENQEVTLTVTYQVIGRCPPRVFCIHGGIQRPPAVIKLPIVKETNTRCGGRTVTAQIDNRRADGNLTRLVIKDNSFNTCMGTSPDVLPVEVTLTEQLARSNKPIVSKLSGSPIQ